MADETTGSTVLGLVPGLKNHIGGSSIMFVLGNPDTVVTPVTPSSATSGGVVAYDTANNQYYQHTVGSTWQKLGSVE